MRALPLAQSLLVFALAIASNHCFGQEPLFLHIRAASAEDAAAEASRARAAREAVWERSDRRARLAIASICKGCLAGPSQDITSAASPLTSDSGEAPVDRSARLAQADAPSSLPTEDRGQ